jgi:hypothetical protein
MAVNAHLTDERGLVLGEVLDRAGAMGRVLSLDGIEQTVCVRFIDPYGDTVFNRAQATVLLGELAGLRPRLDDESRCFLDGIIGLAERVEAGPHLYLKFVGD